MDYDLNALQKRLERRGFRAEVCENRQQAAAYIDQAFAVGGDTVVGMGNSLTLEALGIKALWQDRVSALYQHAIDSTEAETKKALLADVYLTSANALSADGQLVNIDGTGNRVAATCYGPQQVVYVVGKNKIAGTLQEAIDRARNTAAVKNAKRYGRKTPCVTTGKCEDCLSPECLCGVMAIHRRQLYGNHITVVLVNEELGL